MTELREPAADGSMAARDFESGTAVELVRPPEPLRMTKLNPAFARLVGKIPASVLSVPSMMSVPEKRFLYGLASSYYEGRGVIIDAGIFLGASTRCFGEGLQKNPRLPIIAQAWKKPVVSFERGLINPGMPAFFRRNKVDCPGDVGDSFESEVRRNVEPVKELVDLRVGDILETAHGEEPVEILFLDVLKLPEISSFVLRRFFPRLIPGRSIVVQQDYFYERLPYIKTHQEFLQDYFDYIGEIGSTAIFRCNRQIDPPVLDSLDALPADEQLRLASVAMQRSTDANRRFLMALSKMRLIAKLFNREAASEYLAFVKGEFPDQIAATRYSRLQEAISSAEKLCSGGE